MVSRSVVDMLLVLKYLKVDLCPRGSRMYGHVLIVFFMKGGFHFNFNMASMSYQDDLKYRAQNTVIFAFCTASTLHELHPIFGREARKWYFSVSYSMVAGRLFQWSTVLYYQ